MFLGLQEDDILHWLNESDGEPLSDSENEQVTRTTHFSRDSSSDDEENESDTSLSSSKADTASSCTPMHPPIATTVGGRGRARLRGSGEEEGEGDREALYQ